MFEQFDASFRGDVDMLQSVAAQSFFDFRAILVQRASQQLAAHCQKQFAEIEEYGWPHTGFVGLFDQQPDQR